jgi:hypothetical protein
MRILPVLFNGHILMRGRCLRGTTHPGERRLFPKYPHGFRTRIYGVWVSLLSLPGCYSSCWGCQLRSPSFAEDVRSGPSLTAGVDTLYKAHWSCKCSYLRDYVQPKDQLSRMTLLQQENAQLKARLEAQYMQMIQMADKIQQVHLSRISEAATEATADAAGHKEPNLKDADAGASILVSACTV